MDLKKKSVHILNNWINIMIKLDTIYVWKKNNIIKYKK